LYQIVFSVYFVSFFCERSLLAKNRNKLLLIQEKKIKTGKSNDCSVPLYFSGFCLGLQKSACLLQFIGF